MTQPPHEASSPTPPEVLTALYMRWSTDPQEDGTTLEVQRERCLQEVRRRGWHVSPEMEFVDSGYTGTSLQRPALARLRELVQAGRVNTVVVYRLDRLSRSKLDLLHLIQREWADRCSVISVSERIDTATPGGQLFISILAIFADMELDAIRQRMQSGLHRRITQGQVVPLRTAYGYRRVDGGRWEPDPIEAPVVRSMFEWAAGGMSPREITRRLNERGVRTRRGGLFTVTAVRQILRNPVYTGVIVWGQYRRLVQKTGALTLSEVPAGSLAARLPQRLTMRQRRAEPVITAESRAHPPLISRELFKRVQEVLRARSTPTLRNPDADDPGLLTGIARCRCGSAVQVKRRGSGRSPVYCCTHRDVHGLPCPEDSGAVAVDIADELVKQQFQRLVSPESWAHLTRGMRERLEAERRAHQAEMRALEKTLQAQSGRLRQVLADLAARRITPGELSAHTAAIREETQRIKQALENAKARLEDAERRLAELAQLDAIASQVLLWDALTVAERKSLIACLLTDRITFYRRRGSRELTLDIPILLDDCGESAPSPPPAPEPEGSEERSVR